MKLKVTKSNSLSTPILLHTHKKKKILYKKKSEINDNLKR